MRSGTYLIRLSGKIPIHRGSKSCKMVTTSLYRLLSDDKTQLKAWKQFLVLVGINWRKCPSFRTILRVNLCCINSVVFLLATWLFFYVAVISIFCAAVTGSASLLGIQ